QNRLKKFVDGGQLGIFRNGYWGHPQYKLSPEANLMGFAHYLEALDFQREIIKIHTVFAVARLPFFRLVISLSKKYCSLLTA
ncbi:nickel-dependent hydrogenase large subunit, partial [Vibrio cholerae O1]|uniref:nickel-dependent hydrogenase large subunit n=1 Tax=Vibrio cholerae TaxID=666 RepID=UPI001C125F42